MDTQLQTMFGRMEPVRGRVSHADHKTVVLNGWHRVVMNTERTAPGARSVSFSIN